MKKIFGITVLIAVLVAVAFSGCLEETPTATPTPTPAATSVPTAVPTAIPTPTPAEETTISTDIYISDEMAMHLIKSVLMDNGLRGINAQVADGRNKGGVKVLIMSYESTVSTADDLAEETGFILGAYLGAINEGWDVDELSVVVGDREGTAVGMWYCSEEWTDDYLNGKISETELLLKVFSTMTTL